MTTAQSTLNQSIQAGLFEELIPVKTVGPMVEMSFDDKVASSVNAIKQQVLSGRHIAVAYSGGKDSSCTLNLAFTALRELKEDGVAIPMLHLVHSDTKLENPIVETYNKGQLRSIEAYAETIGISTRVWLASPNLSNDYLVSLLSGRTIMSFGSNSKCSVMMKSAPLDKIKRQVRAFIADADNIKAKDVQLVSLIGTRFDESISRATKMKERGESSTEAVDAMDNGHLVLSPIAHWSTLDVFTYIGYVRSNKIESYNSFDELVDLYRDANGGDCMVVAYLANKEQTRPACGARLGCWCCSRIGKTDKSAENLLASDDGKYDWMTPLRDLRSYMIARHFDPSARCWLARTINEETGTVKVTPNAYGPQYSLELLRIILTIQIREEIAAGRLGIAPRFTLLDERQLIAIDFISARYGYQNSFVALRTYKEIYEGGMRYDIPALDSMPVFTEKDVAFRAEVPFVDAEYYRAWRGFRNVSHAMADWENTTTLADGSIVQNANLGDEFEIDEEGAALFMAFDVDYALNRIGLLDNPMAVVDYFVSLGTVTLYKGSLGEWDRMARMSNQIFYSGIKDVLNDPHALVKALHAKHYVETEAPAPAMTQEAALEQLAFWL